MQAARHAFLDVLPSKSEIFDYWKDRLSGLGLFIDWGEPGCWACGFHYGSKYDIKRSDADWDMIFRVWNRVPLQRCHIVPRSLRGSDDAANLFLMCRECHDLAPNTGISEIFFEWARSQSWHKRESAKISAALESYGVGRDAMEELNELIVSAEFKAWLSGKFGLHRPQSNYAPVSSRLTPATFIGLAIHYQRTSRAIDSEKQRNGKNKRRARTGRP